MVEQAWLNEGDVIASPTPKESPKAIPSLNPDIKPNRRIIREGERR